MIHALLVCMQGMSTAMMEKKMLEAAQKEGVELDIHAIAANQLKDVSGKDIVILGPQLKYAEKNIRAQLDETPVGKNVPVYVIEPTDFGMMRGDVVLKKIVALLEK